MEHDINLALIIINTL